MNKTEFVKEIAQRMEVTQKQAGEFVDKFWDVVKEGTLADGEVKFTGVGTFKKVEKEAYVAKNPKTGEPVDVDASTSIKFSSGSGLKKL